MVTTVTAATTNGLKYRYFEGTWDALPNFNTLDPVSIGTTPNTDISIRRPGVNDNFAFLWEGLINLQTPGAYTFELISDDGSKFYFNSFYAPRATPVINNDGLHAPTSQKATVNITAAGLYPISAVYFEKDGGETMQLYISGPDLPRQLVPNSAFVNNNPSTPTQNNSLTITNAATAEMEESADVTSNITSLSAYPNPFTESLKIQYSSLTPAAAISAGIYDMGGRLVQRQVFRNTVAGLNTLSIHLNPKMIPGMYLVKLEVNGRQVKMWKMIKERK